MAMLVPITTQLTQAEQRVVEFLYKNKGKEFSEVEIQEGTGIRADLVPAIMDNLRFKGYEVGSKHGVHFFIKNTWMSYVAGAGIFGFMFIILVFAMFSY